MVWNGWSQKKIIPVLTVKDEPFLASQETKELGKPEKKGRLSGREAIAKGLWRTYRGLTWLNRVKLKSLWVCFVFFLAYIFIRHIGNIMGCVMPFTESNQVLFIHHHYCLLSLFFSSSPFFPNSSSTFMLSHIIHAHTHAHTLTHKHRWTHAHIFTIYSFIDRHLGNFHFLAIVNTAAVNTDEQVSLRYVDSDIYPGAKNPIEIPCLVFRENFSNFHSDCTNLNSHPSSVYSSSFPTCFSASTVIYFPLKVR